jgi:DNA-binding response OmpR family regulator
MKAHRITLADDDPDTLFVLHRMLARLYPNSSISMFSDAEDALTHILDTGTDILITNHGMGEMSGLEVIRELRIRQWTIPIIMISGSASAEEEALSAGATEFLDKAIDPKVLEAHVRALMELFPTSDTKPVRRPARCPHTPRPTHASTKS